VSTSRQRGGAATQVLAAALLARHGLAVLARVHRCHGGAFDRVARDGATVVFVEMGYRRSRAYGGAGASVDARKQARILLAARH